MNESTGCFKDESECPVNSILFNTQEHLLRQPQWPGQRQVTQEDNGGKSACLHLWLSKQLISHLLGCPNTAEIKFCQFLKCDIFSQVGGDAHVNDFYQKP